MSTPNNEKQHLLIEYLLSSPDTFALCKSIVNPTYFDPSLRKSVAFIHEYYDMYNAVPSPDQLHAETNVAFKLHTTTRDQVAYCSTEIEKFCKIRALEQALISGTSQIKENPDAVYQMVKDAIAVSLNKDMGIDYFTNPRERLEGMLAEPPRTSTGWGQVDALLNGGLARTEMIMFSANSGGGKSVALANLAVNFVAQQLDVLYLTFELSEVMVSQRFDSLFTGIPSLIWRQKYKDIAADLETMSDGLGKLVVKRMRSGATANMVRGYLKEYELKFNKVPDLLIVDYLDIMGANDPKSADNISEKDKQAAEQLRDIGFDYNMFIATASQQNRSAIGATELNQGHIAGGLTKINTVDVYASIILSDTMRAQGEIGFAFLKTRSSDGVGKTAYQSWDNVTLRIANLQKSGDAIMEKVAMSAPVPKTTKSLADIFDL